LLSRLRSDAAGTPRHVATSNLTSETRVPHRERSAHRRRKEEGAMRTSTWFQAAMLAVIPLAVAQAADAPPSDPQIAAIVVAANQVDIDAGKLAVGKAQSPEVKALAQRMVTDHTGVNDKAGALVRKLGVTPQSNPTSESLLQGGKDTLARLRGLQGAAFDKAYVANEVTYHETVIDALDKTLIPHAKNKELHDLLVQVRPAFVSHLEHARHLQSKLGGAAAK
jgi:putative membrane protein